MWVLSALYGLFGDGLVYFTPCVHDAYVRVLVGMRLRGDEKAASGGFLRTAGFFQDACDVLASLLE